MLVLFSFERSEEELERLGRLARWMGKLKNTKPAEPMLRKVADIPTNELAIPHRRRKLPEEFSGPGAVYAADLLVVREFLPEGYLTQRVHPCFAERGDRGGILHVPHWLVDAPAGEWVREGVAPVACPTPG
jgi:hypothetical protein